MFAFAQLAGAAVYTWNVSSGNWSDPSSWTPTPGAGGPLAVDTVTFGNTGASTSSNTVNNTVDASFAGTVANMTNSAVSITPFNFNVTQIPTGKTLTVTNRVVVGGLNEGAGPFLTYAFMNGGGTFMFTGTNLAVENYGTAAGANTYANLDLSGLANFVFNNPNGSISIADTTLPQTSGSLNVRAGGNMVLAGGSNSITASTINLATCNAPQGGPLSTLALGTGTNIINVGTFNIANNKNSANVFFAGPTGGLRIRGSGGTVTSRATIIVGNKNVGGGTGVTTGQLLLNGHPVDILANRLVVGEVSVTGGPSGSGSGGQFGNGTMQFDTGTVDATNVVMAFNSAPNANNGLSGSTSLLTVGANATLRVGTGGISLINQTVSNVCSSTLTISNGTVVCNGNITAVTNAAAGTGTAAATNIINIIGSGTLTLGSGCFAGTISAPIGQLSLDTSSTLQFVAPPPNNQAAIAVNTLVWPATDAGLTFVVSNLPATAHVGTTIPLIEFAVTTGGTFTSPALVLPAGVGGSLSLSGNTVLLTITSSIFPSLTPISPSLTTLSTNTALTTTASSSVSTITDVQVIVTTNTLGGLTSTTVTNLIGSPLLTVTGLGTATANISYALATNTIYQSVTVRVTDANAKSVSLGGANFDTLVPSLVIEATDFNFSNGGFFDTSADGGFARYTNQVGLEGVDEHKATRAGAKSYYRTNDNVIIQAANPEFGTPPSATEQKFVSAAAGGDTLNVEQEVGFNTPGDWLNYSRTFGGGGSAPAGLYNVWAYLATSGSGVQASFSQVTSDPSQGSQTTNFLGNFGTSAFTDNGFNNYVYVPLVDQFGNRAAVSVGSGKQTFKSTVVGNPNLAFYLFVPVAPVLTPTLLHVYPDGTTPYQQTNSFTFTVSPAQGASIAANGIHLILNGVDVSSGASFSQAGGVWTISLPLASNFVYTGTITVTNTSGLGTSFSLNFDTFNQNNYQWEAVDYDFSTNNGTGDGGTAGGGWSGGLFIDNPVPTGSTNLIPNNGTTAANSYWYWPTAWTIANDGYGAIAQQGVDINWPTNTNQGQSQANAAYRFPDLVGSQIASDFVRAKFLAAQASLSDPAICQYNIGYFYASNWLNYTRTFPANTYNIWGRLAGGGGAFTNVTLSLVTSGVGTSNQTTQVLGSFSDANPAGWQAYHTIPLLDTNGNMVTVPLGGKATLRLTSSPTATPASGALNPLYFMLTPATAPATFRISAAVAGNQINISIPTQLGHTYTLLHADTLSGANWTQVGNTITGTGTVVVVPQSTASLGFYRAIAH
jgi:hypothetical protein